MIGGIGLLEEVKGTEVAEERRTLERGPEDEDGEGEDDVNGRGTEEEFIYNLRNQWRGSGREAEGKWRKYSKQEAPPARWVQIWKWREGKKVEILFSSPPRLFLL